MIWNLIMWAVAMTFIRLLKLTEQGIQALRDQQNAMNDITKIIEDNGGKMVGAWFTQGEYDLISIIECEDEKAIRTIAARVAVKGYYSGKTLPAMPIGEFVAHFAGNPSMSMFLESWFRAGRGDRRR
jgi:uncharacterized protein with GYD domain